MGRENVCLSGNLPKQYSKIAIWLIFRQALPVPEHRGRLPLVNPSPSSHAEFFPPRNHAQAIRLESVGFVGHIKRGSRNHQ
jgi:hypothetical protein